MQGLRLGPQIRFAALWAALPAAAAELFWHLDLQSGPFDFMGRDDWEAIDGELEALAVETGEAPPGTLWRPGVFPRFAPLLVHDEWGYHLGLEGPEAAAVSSARALSAGADYTSPDFFAAFADRGVLFALLAPDGWEIYSPRRAWLARLAREWNAEPVDSSHWAAAGG